METPVTSLINRIAVLAGGLLVLCAITSVPAAAQEPAPPRDVNDCTFLRDPTKVRTCIESFQGSVQTPDVAPQSASPLLLTLPPATPATPAQQPPQAPPPRLAPR
jgi:hypothetical protein